MNLRVIAATLGLLLASTGVFACGFCIEDKIAAVYDHALIAQAVAQGHRVAFFAIDGPLEANSAQRGVIERSAAKVRGVDPRSVRVSVESAALSLGFDPARASAEQILQSVQNSLVLKGLTLQLLKVMDMSAENGKHDSD